MLFVDDFLTFSLYGLLAAKRQPDFFKLPNRLESGDMLVVTKFNRLGRNAMEIRQTEQ